MKRLPLCAACVLMIGTLFAGLGHAQVPLTSIKRIVTPDTPQNARLVDAVQAGNLPAVQAALQAGASADTEIGYEGQIEMTPVAVISTVSPFMGRIRSPAIFQLLIQNASPSAAADPKIGAALLSAAVEMDDLDSVRQLVIKGADVNARFLRASNPLIQSVEQNVNNKTLSPVTVFLLDHGAQVNAKDAGQTTPLMLAAMYDKMDVLQALLAHGADPALRDRQGWTALRWAALRGWEDAVSLLRDRSPMDIYEAAQFGDVTRLKAHLDAGDNPNAPGFRGTTPLMEAMKSGSLTTVRLLLDRGALVNQKRPDGTTALHLAALYGDAPLAGLLLDRGANINALGGNPRIPSTPLTYAVRQAQVDMVALLLKRGADVKHGQGEAALELAVREAGDGFVRRPANAPARRVPRGDAVYDAREKIIDLLLAGGVSLRSGSSHALYLAASGGQDSLVELFLSKGADVNDRGASSVPANGSDTGGTALMGAVEAWSSAYTEEEMLKDGTEEGGDLKDIHQNEQLARQSVTLLLSHGADVNLPDARGTTPLMLCVSYELPTLANLLLTHGAKVDVADPTGQTALMQAAQAGSTPFAALLLAHGAAVNRRDTQGRTALMLAIDDGSNEAYRAEPSYDEYPSGSPNASLRPALQKDLPNPDGHPHMVRLLLRHGADLHIAASDGSMALSLARKQHFGSVVMLLTRAGARR